MNTANGRAQLTAAFPVAPKFATLEPTDRPTHAARPRHRFNIPVTLVVSRTACLSRFPEVVRTWEREGPSEDPGHTRGSTSYVGAINSDYDV